MTVVACRCGHPGRRHTDESGPCEAGGCICGGFVESVEIPVPDVPTGTTPTAALPPPMVGPRDDDRELLVPLRPPSAFESSIPPVQPPPIDGLVPPEPPTEPEPTLARPPVVLSGHPTAQEAENVRRARLITRVKREGSESLRLYAEMIEADLARLAADFDDWLRTGELRAEVDRARTVLEAAEEKLANALDEVAKWRCSCGRPFDTMDERRRHMRSANRMNPGSHLPVSDLDAAASS